MGLECKLTHYHLCAVFPERGIHRRTKRDISGALGLGGVALNTMDIQAFQAQMQLVGQLTSQRLEGLAKAAI